MENSLAKLRSLKGRNLKVKPRKRLDKNESLVDQGKGPHVTKDVNQDLGVKGPEKDSIAQRLRKREPTKHPVTNRTNTKSKATQPTIINKISSQKRKSVRLVRTEDKKAKLADKKSVKSSAANNSAAIKSTTKKKSEGSFNLQEEQKERFDQKMEQTAIIPSSLVRRVNLLPKFIKVSPDVPGETEKRSLGREAECGEPSTPENRDPSTPEMSPTLVNSIKTKSGKKPIKSIKRRILTSIDDQDPLVFTVGLPRKIRFLDLDVNVNDELLEVSNGSLEVVSPEVDVDVAEVSNPAPVPKTKKSRGYGLPLIPLSKKKVVGKICQDNCQKSSGSDGLAGMFSDPESD